MCGVHGRGGERGVCVNTSSHLASTLSGVGRVDGVDMGRKKADRPD